MHYPSEFDYDDSMIYSKPEVDMRADEMSRLLAAVETNVPDAQDNYEKYKQDAATATRESMNVRCVSNHSMSCSSEWNWLSAYHRMQYVVFDHLS